MRSQAYAYKDQVWMRLATDPEGRGGRTCQFDSIEVAEDLGLAILRACVQAREYSDTNQEALF